jgi:hypothetical protein
MWSDLVHRLRAVFRRTAVEHELDRELQFHVERRAEKYMKSGSSEDAAFRRARLELGGICWRRGYERYAGI